MPVILPRNFAKFIHISKLLSRSGLNNPKITFTIWYLGMKTYRRKLEGMPLTLSRNFSKFIQISKWLSKSGLNRPKIYKKKNNKNAFWN